MKVSADIYEKELSKGIFWFICSFDEENRCDFSETEMITLSVACDQDGETAGSGDFNSRHGNAFNHRAAWPSLVRDRKDLRRYDWNYFPRGRVEIGGGKATIYLNINIIQCRDFLERIVERFCLEGLKTRVVVDNSRHYHCYGDKEQ